MIKHSQYLGIDEGVEDLNNRHRGKRVEARTTIRKWRFLWPFSAEGPQAGSFVGGGPKLAPVIRSAKVVPVSMADGESAELLWQGSAMSRERPASGQEQQERQGERRPSEGGAGWGSRESKAAGA